MHPDLRDVRRCGLAVEQTCVTFQQRPFLAMVDSLRNEVRIDLVIMVSDAQLSLDASQHRDHQPLFV
ncbi:hypothetical protein D3C71_1884560 [compost metagenome]